MRLVLAFLTTLALVSACSGGASPATIDGYHVDRAGRTLTLDVAARPGATVQAEVVREESSRVTVRVRVTSPKGDSLDLRKRYPVTLSLKSPLGQRTVVTEEGNTLAPTPVPR